MPRQSDEKLRPFEEIEAIAKVIHEVKMEEERKEIREKLKIE